MAVDLSPIDESLLAEIANIHGMPKGAFNIRKDGELVERHSSANIEIATKTDNPGIDIRIKAGTKGETVYIPVIVTQSGLKDVVYNTFYIEDDCDVTIIAGCGIHNESHQASEHDGIHTFYCGKNSRVKYVEKHYGEGTGTGERILNPVTNVIMDENSSCEMELTQLRGVSSTVRDTNAELGAGAKLVLTEKLLTHDDQVATSNMKVELKGDDSSVQVISRSVAQDNSKQVFNPLVIGEAACRGHVQCDAIIMGKAKVTAIPGIEAASEDALLVHEAAIGKIAGDQITKLMTLGLTEEEAEQEILETSNAGSVGLTAGGTTRPAKRPPASGLAPCAPLGAYRSTLGSAAGQLRTPGAFSLPHYANPRGVVLPPNAARMFHVKHLFARTSVSRETL